MSEQKKKRILIVDDEPLNLKYLKHDLERSSYETVSAEDGTDAISILKTDQGFDVILLDRMMPKMDGMEVLVKIKADELLKDIPVIMQTAAASTEQIEEGIKGGVFYYLTKPFSCVVMKAIVESAIKDRENELALKKKVSRFTRSLGLMDLGVFRYRTISEVHGLANMVANCCPNPQKVILGLTELMINAVEHGNLGLSYQDKVDLLTQGDWHQEIETRLNKPEYANKFARIRFERKETSIEFSVSDEGKGFDWEEYMEISAARAMDPNGRGIAMAKMMSFDRIEYMVPGNRVACSIFLDPASLEET